MAKLRHYRRRIKKCCAAEYYTIRGEKTKLMEKIRDIDREKELSELPQDRFSKREELKGHLSKVLKDEESLWRPEPNNTG